MKKKTIKAISVLSLLIMVNSCAFKNNMAVGKAGVTRIPQFTYDEKGTFLWTHFDATKRGGIIYITPENKIRVLAENAPDAAIQSIVDISAKMSGVKEINAELALNTQKSIAELGKRTASVNILRDALYRINELYYSTYDDKTAFIKKYLSDYKNKSMSLSEVKNFIEEINNAPYGLSKTDVVNMYMAVLSTVSTIAIAEAKNESSIVITTISGK